MNIPNMLERFWPEVMLTPISVSGYIITVPDTAGLHPKMLVTLSLGSLSKPFEIKRVLSDTQLQVGIQDKDMAKFENPVEFNGGMLFAVEQERNRYSEPLVLRSVYQEEPAVALRTILVDQYGASSQYIRDPQGVNRLAVDADISIDSAVVNVDLDGVYSGTNLQPDNVGIIAHTRILNPTDVNQTMRLSSIQGTVDADVRALDISLHDHNGNAYTDSNPLSIKGQGLNGNVTVEAVNFDIRDLVFATDKVDVSGSAVSITNFPTEIIVNQGTTPWIVAGTDLDIRDLVFATDKVDVSGSTVAVTQTTTPWIVAATDFDIRNLVFADDKVDVTGSTVIVNQGTTPWVVSATDFDIRDLTFAQDKVDVSGSAVSITNFPAVQDVNIVSSIELEIKNDVNNPIPVSAVDFDIRDLVFATDKVDVSGSTVAVTQSTTPWIVAATDLDIRDLVFATDKVDVTGSTVTVNQGTNPWIVAATDLDIRNLTFAQDKVDATGSTVTITNTTFTVNQGTSPWVTSTTNGNLETTQQQVLAELQSIDDSLNDIELRLETWDTNFGTVGNNTLRTASQLADGAGNMLTSATKNTAPVTMLHIQSPDTVTPIAALNALNAAVTISMEGMKSVGFSLSAGTFRGTLVAEYSVAGASGPWTDAFFFNSSDFSVSRTVTFTANNTDKVLSVLSPGGTSHVRVRVSAFTSGTANAILRATETAGTTSGFSLSAFNLITNYYPAVPKNTPTLILATNLARKYAYISNPTKNAVTIQFGDGTGLSTSRGLVIPAQGKYEIVGENLYTGPIYAFCAAAITLSVSEGTP